MISSVRRSGFRSGSRRAPRTTRTVVMAATLSTAFALTACGDDDTDEPAPEFTTTETASSSGSETSESETSEASEASEASESSGASEASEAPDSESTGAEPSESEEASAPAGDSSGDIEISVTAPDGTGFNSGGIIKTGQTDFEMTGDYTEADYRTDLPSVGWKPKEDLKSCSTRVTYNSEDGTEIAQYRTQDCDASPSEGETSSEYEWLDRSPLPSQGQEAPLVVKVEIESGDDTYEGETTITLRNPNNYR